MREWKSKEQKITKTHSNGQVNWADTRNNVFFLSLFFQIQTQTTIVNLIENNVFKATKALTDNPNTHKYTADRDGRTKFHSFMYSIQLAAIIFQTTFNMRLMLGQSVQ